LVETSAILKKYKNKKNNAALRKFHSKTKKTIFLLTTRRSTPVWRFLLQNTKEECLILKWWQILFLKVNYLF